MKSYKFLLLLNFVGWGMLFCPPVIAENTIKISQDHFNNLGVTLGKLEPVKQIPLVFFTILYLVHGLIIVCRAPIVNLCAVNHLFIFYLKS